MSRYGNQTVYWCAFFACLSWGLAGGIAFAQEEDEDEAVLEEVIVTGSRIKRRDFSSPSPITTISKDAFEFSGQPTMEDYLNQMPQVVPDFGRTSNNPGDGTARLNLRGLGATRTLVLMNGRRVAPSGVGGAVDVNNLPKAMVDRVEIITGGASTVYGSDAIAGVVNFITRQDFTGLSIDGSYYITEQGDSDIYDANIVYGHNLAGGRGNITLYAGYYERKPTLAGERGISSVPYLDTWENYEIIPFGSGTIPNGVVITPRVDLGTGADRATWNPDGSVRAWDSFNDRYNYQPLNYLQTPLTRYSIGLQATIDLNAGFESYVEAAYMYNKAKQNLAEAPFTGQILVNTDNPVLSPDTRQLFEDQLSIEPGLASMVFRRRMLELGPRIIESDRKYARLVAGIRGDINDNWALDAWITYTDGRETEKDYNDGSRARLLQGLLVDPVTGQCYDPSGGCVPLDLFGEGRLSQEGADFIRVPPLENVTRRKQTLASVVVTGAPFDIWTGPVNMAFGAEWHKDDASFSADDALFTGDTISFIGSAPVKGTESVWELYTEALVPLIDNQVSGHYLSLELGARYSSYKNAGSVWTYKYGGEWQPIPLLRFRTMFQHAVRAPNNLELFQQQFTQEGSVISDLRPDPCSASQDPAGNGIADKCALQGLPPDQIGVFEAEPYYPVYGTFGGNPDLTPESSDTKTVGVVITPETLPNLTVAIDWFDIEVTDTIGEISAMDICFNSTNTGNVFCENIQRDASGNINTLYEPISNRGLLGVRGVDTQLHYQADLPSSWAIVGGQANLGINFIWSHYLSITTQDNIATDVRECVGLFGWPCHSVDQGDSFPQDKINIAVDYSTGPLEMHLAWRWVEGMDNAAPLMSGDFGYPDPELGVPDVPSYNYTDLGFAYHFNEKLMVRFGVNNLFDKDPPMQADAVFSNNTDSRLYDVFGRAYYVSFVWNVFE